MHSVAATTRASEPNTMDEEERESSKFVPLWRRNEAKAQKSGTRGTIYWVRRSAKFKEFQRDGLLTMSKEPAEFITGDSYAGDWLHNRKHGFGSMTYANGKRYQGDFRNGKREGTGTLWIMKDGKLRKTYSGCWKNGKRHGTGIHFDEFDHVYEGEWVRGKRSGRGKLTYTNGDVYDGEFAENKRSGLGIMLYANNDRYEGHWADDMKDGHGKFYFAATRKLLEAEWVKDSPKSGVFSDWPGSEILESKEEDFNLPVIGLEDAQGVLDEAFKETRRLRAESLGHRSTMEAKSAEVDDEEMPVFTEDELCDIADAFHAVDTEKSGQIIGDDLGLVLCELGIEPSPEDVEQLLLDLGASFDTPITLTSFIGLLASLRAPEEVEEEEAGDDDDKNLEQVNQNF